MGYKKIKAIILSASLIVFFTKAYSEELLSIDPVYQNTPVWCWAAVGEMVFRYYDIPTINPVGDFQCGIVALMHPTCEYNCGNCILPAGSLNYMNNMLRRYPEVARFRTQIPSGRITTRTAFRALTRSELENEIDNGRPIVAGISPSGFSSGGTSQHVALIVGYERSEGNLYIIVNDPFPYRAQIFNSRENPFIRAEGEETESGQYRIKYENFRGRLQWRESIYRISCDGIDCPH